MYCELPEEGWGPGVGGLPRRRLSRWGTPASKGTHVGAPALRSPAGLAQVGTAGENRSAGVSGTVLREGWVKPGCVNTR